MRPSEHFGTEGFSFSLALPQIEFHGPWYWLPSEAGAFVRQPIDSRTSSEVFHVNHYELRCKECGKPGATLRARSAKTASLPWKSLTTTTR